MMNASKPALLALLSSAFVVTVQGCRVDEQESGATGTDMSAAQHEAIVITDEARAGLNKLISTDAEVRRTALSELALEFSSAGAQTESKYSDYGNALLPVLHRVILDLDDPYAHMAIKAIFWMGTYRQFLAQLEMRELDAVSRQELQQELEKISHYPIPSNYAPLKEALINVLKRSENSKTRHWAARALAGGFEPVSEIEGVLATQFALEQSNWKVQLAIIGSLSALADRNEVKRSTELVIIDALSSPNPRIRETAVQIVRTHQFEGGLERLVQSISTARDVRELRAILYSITLFDEIDDVHIVALENAAASSDDEDKTKALRSTIRMLQFANTDLEHNFGLIRTDQSSILLYTAHRGLKPDTRIAVIGSDVVLYVVMPTGEEKQVSPNVQIGSFPVVTYYVGIFSNSIDPELIENRVVNFSPASGNYPMSSLSHSSCTSKEGVHHSVWSTGNAGRVRLWFAYQHLDYAVEPTCSDDDLAK